MSLPSAEIAYQQAHIGDDRQYQFIVTNVVCLIASIIVVCLRFFSRSVTKASLGADDWTILIALVSHLH